MVKKLLFAGLVCSLVLMLCVIPAHASTCSEESTSSTQKEDVPLRWSDTYSVSCNVSANGNTLTLSLSVKAKKTTTAISGTMYLQKYENGTWKNVTYWNVSGKGRITMTPTFNGTSGCKYRTRVSIKVGSDQIDKTSNEVSL